MNSKLFAYGYPDLHAYTLVGQYLVIGKEGYALLCGRSPTCAQVLVNAFVLWPVICQARYTFYCLMFCELIKIYTLFIAIF